jgi:hypothetical protein
MPKKIGNVDRTVLTGAALPPATKTYTVISHSYAINTIMQALENNGFEVTAEEYKCTTDAKVAHGTFLINYKGDPDLSLMYTFNNSYDKSLRFRAAIGARINDNGAYMINNMDSWLRKHTGTADQEAHDLINGHIENAVDYFEQLVRAKEQMTELTISKQEFGSIIGELFINDFLAVDQVSLIRKEFNKPSYNYVQGRLNLWTCYQILADALRLSHPAKWMNTQVQMHLYFITKYNIDVFDVDESDENEDTSDTESNSEDQAVDVEVNLPGFDNVELPEGEELHTQMEEENAELEVASDNIPQLQGSDYDEEEYEKVNLDAEEDDDWDKLEEAGVIAEVKEEPKHSLEGIEGGHQFTPDNKATEEATAEMLYGVDNGDIEITNAPINILAKEEIAEELYFEQADYPGYSIGDVLDVEGNYYEVKGIEDIYYLCAAIDVVDEEVKAEGFDNTTIDNQEDLEHQEKLDEASAEASMEFIISEEPVEEVKEVLPVMEIEETVEEKVEEEHDPIKDTIGTYIEEIYGYIPEFTYTTLLREYNVVLETGESLVINKSMVEEI